MNPADPKVSPQRRTKVIATYGPALCEPAMLAKAIEAGVDLFRLNFSHGTHDEYASAISTIRRLADQRKRPVAILQDLRGPKIRAGELPGGSIILRDGEGVRLFAGTASDSPDRIPVEGYPTLDQDVSAGERILLNDGAIRLRVGGIEGGELRCAVEVGGSLVSRKGINFPDTALRSVRVITQKDTEDLAFGLLHGVDLVALSFVRSAEDVRALQKLLKEAGSDKPIIAKIEKREALENLDQIIAVADGVMVARGDLGVETDLAEVALRQKEIIGACNWLGRPVITATQMLESMITHPSPTRAEVSDISNAIIDGTDALMLSGETAIGSYPIDAISMMVRIAERTESVLDLEQEVADRPFLDEIPDAVAHAACVTARQIDASALICCTMSGLTARLVSRYRPSCPIVAVSPVLDTVRRLMLVWGVIPLHSDTMKRDEGRLAVAVEEARQAGWVRRGERVVVTAGLSSGALEGKTNLVRVEIV